MKKLLVILAVMAIAGSAMAAEGTVEVNVTINDYIEVEGQSHSETIDPVYNGSGIAYISTVVAFNVAANVAWNGTASVDSDWWMQNTDHVDGMVPGGPSEVRTGGPSLINNQTFLIGKEIGIADGQSFGGTVTFTVAAN